MVKSYRGEQLAELIQHLNRHELQQIITQLDALAPAAVDQVMGLTPVAAAGDQALMQQTEILASFRHRLAKRHAGSAETSEIGDDLNELLHLNWQHAKKGQYVLVFTNFLAVFALLAWLQERTHDVLNPRLMIDWLQELVDKLAKCSKQPLPRRNWLRTKTTYYHLPRKSRSIKRKVKRA